MKTLCLISAAVLLAACGSRRDFAPVADEAARDLLALSPVAATAAGYHEHKGQPLDSALDDFSAAGLERQRAAYKEIRERLERAITPQSSADDHADHHLLRNQIELALLDLETIRSFEHNPTVYVELLGNALFTPYVIEYAAKPQRYQHIIARLQSVRRLMTEARANLKDAPEVWNRVAREENDGTIALIDTTIRADCPPELKANYDTASGEALTALREFNHWLETDLSKRTSDWRLGRERYADKLRYALDTGETPEQLLAAAEERMAEIHKRMEEIAKPGTVETALDKVAKKHATPAGYFDQAKSDLEEARAFVGERKLMALPGRSNLQVIPTPVFMRGIYGVGGFSPAPVLEPKLGAFYWITPLPEKGPAERVESKLREYNFYGLKILTVHEAMPGHWLQAEYAADIQPAGRRLVRGLFGNNPYIEGWAVYATQLMIDEGYYKNDPGMQLTWGKQALRAISNTILDIRMQTMGMTDQEAMDLMIKKTHQEREEAVAKLQRAQLSSCQLPTYFAGWRSWEKIRAQQNAAQGAAFDLRNFHERALKAGAVTLPDLGELLAK